MNSETFTLPQGAPEVVGTCKLDTYRFNINNFGKSIFIFIFFYFFDMFLNKTKNIFLKNLKHRKNRKNLESWNFEIFRKHIFCFVKEHIEKIKNLKIKIHFYKLLILNRYVSNLQVPTTTESLWGKVNVSKFMDFAEIRLLGRKKPTFGTIKKTIAT